MTFRNFFPKLTMGILLGLSFQAKADLVERKVERNEVATLTTTSNKEIQWQLSSDLKAWYTIPNATESSFDYTANNSNYLRAVLTDAENNISYSDTTHIIFPTKEIKKTIKTPGGHGYAEDALGHSTNGISIEEDRGSDGHLRLTAVSKNWSNRDAILTWYLYHNASGDFDIDLQLQANNLTVRQYEFLVIDINQNGLAKDTLRSIISVRGTGNDFNVQAISLQIPKKGYYKYALRPLTSQTGVVIKGLLFNSTKSIVSTVHPTNYLSSPSVHLSSWRTTETTTQTNQKYDWCYEEVLVPEGYDPVSTYYMTLGVLRGYMGIQTNSLTQRRILFSMWDDGDTDHNDDLPSYLRACEVDYAPYTTVNRFGNEGTGMQSYVTGWNWDTGVPVKFLCNARLEEFNDTIINSEGETSIVLRQNTLVSAWFNSNPDKGWQYISTLRLPNKISYFDSWYSFLENFGRGNGQQKRKAYYYNAFAREVNNHQPGQWRHFNVVNFGHTDGNPGQRVDYEQGASNEKEGAFYMASGGYGPTVKTANQVALLSDRSAVEELDLTLFEKRVDLAIKKEKRRNDSIANIKKSILTKAGWRVTNFSSQETSGEGAVNGRASCILDNDQNTYWHSAWTSGGSSFPHTFTIKMDKVNLVTGYMFNLSGGSSRHMKDIKVEGSVDGKSYTTVLETACPDKETFYLPLTTPTEMRYFKLTIINSQTGVVHCRINELDVTAQQTVDETKEITTINNQLLVYPNPAKNSCYLSLKKEGSFSNAFLTIYNSCGKSVFQKRYSQVTPNQIHEIDITSLKDGFYSIVLQGSGKRYSTLLFVKK